VNGQTGNEVKHHEKGKQETASHTGQHGNLSATGYINFSARFIGLLS
jgi:hypothetical protein